MLIPIISLWINGLFKFFVDGSTPFYITSLGGFVEPNGSLFGLLNGIEIFAIWHFILRAKGLQIVAKLQKTYSWIIAFIFFAVLLILISLTDQCWKQLNNDHIKRLHTNTKIHYYNLY